jgi:hypothetical protein
LPLQHSPLPGVKTNQKPKLHNRQLQLECQLLHPVLLHPVALLPVEIHMQV